MNKIPTAKDFQINYYLEEHDEGGYLGLNDEEISKMLINFTKLHVEAAIKTALNNVKYADGNHSAVNDIDEDSILNAYPLDNIK